MVCWRYVEWSHLKDIRVQKLNIKKDMTYLLLHFCGLLYFNLTKPLQLALFTIIKLLFATWGQRKQTLNPSLASYRIWICITWQCPDSAILLFKLYTVHLLFFVRLIIFRPQSWFKRTVSSQCGDLTPRFSPSVDLQPPSRRPAGETLVIHWCCSIWFSMRPLIFRRRKPLKIWQVSFYPFSQRNWNTRGAICIC